MTNRMLSEDEMKQHMGSKFRTASEEETFYKENAFAKQEDSAEPVQATIDTNELQEHLRKKFPQTTHRPEGSQHGVTVSSGKAETNPRLPGLRAFMRREPIQGEHADVERRLLALENAFTGLIDLLHEMGDQQVCEQLSRILEHWERGRST